MKKKITKMSCRRQLFLLKFHTSLDNSVNIEKTYRKSIPLVLLNRKTLHDILLVGKMKIPQGDCIKTYLTLKNFPFSAAVSPDFKDVNPVKQQLRVTITCFLILIFILFILSFLLQQLLFRQSFSVSTFHFCLLSSVSYIIDTLVYSTSQQLYRVYYHRKPVQVTTLSYL